MYLYMVGTALRMGTEMGLRTGNTHVICTGFERDLNGNGGTIERPVHRKVIFDACCT